MSCNRRELIKQTSLALGASMFGAPQLLRGALMGGWSRPELRGRVRSGNGGAALPLPGAEVRLYEAGDGPPQLRGTATSNASGKFAIRVQAPGRRARGVFYVTADLPGGLQLATVLAPSPSPVVTINELTTVAAGYCMAQFATRGLVSGDELGLQIAAGMGENLATPVTGESSPVITSSPNADETNTWRSTLALSNLLAYFVRRGGAGIRELYGLATPPGGNPPSNLLQALSNIARFPHQNAAQLYTLAKEATVYAPTLERQPDAWTLVVKVNDSGDDNYLIGGPGSLTFDEKGYAWITNNSVQGTGQSSKFNVVLKPNGKPADGTGGTPISPLVGGGILGAGIGVGIAKNGNVWFGNFGWGLPRFWPSPEGNGSISLFTADGQPISGPRGFQGGPYRAQAVVPDEHGNIWIASFGNNRLYVFLDGNPRRSVYYEDPAGNAQSTFDIDFGPDGSTWATFGGGLRPNGLGYVGRFFLRRQRLEAQFLEPVGDSLKGVVVDSYGKAWIASGGDDAVYMMNEQGRRSVPFQGGGINGPWGITLDGDDNVWVGNFGPEVKNDNYTTSALTKLAGNNPATRPPGLAPGDPISPPSGYTLPSAGDEVLLHNGQPLYGDGPLDPPCFTPLMRVTAVKVDRAGNLWAANNWKPNIDIDVLNPGGDGMCIFVGLAKPRTYGV